MDTVNSNVPVGHRLKILQSISDGWANLRFSRHSTLAYPLASSYVYEVSGGRLVLGSDLDRIGSHLNGTSVLSVHEFIRPGIDPADVSLETDAISRKDIHLKFPIADFAMDAHQNLLVLVQRTPTHSMKLHLRTLDSNVPHPDAAEPILEIQNQSWVTIHISGSALACLFVEPVPNATDFVVVWDWKSGHMLGQVTGSKQKSFVLVSPTSLVVANLDQDTLDVYDIDRDVNTLTLVQRLLLPSVKGAEGSMTWTYDDALLRSHPMPLPQDCPAASRSTLAPHTELPFTTDEEDGIVACTFYCHSIGNSFTLVVHRSSLRRVYNEDTEPRIITRAGKVIQERLIPWSDWGPGNTRWINTEPSQRWICYVHGHRLAVLEQKGGRLDDLLTDISMLSEPSDDDDDDPVQQRRSTLIRDHLERIRDGKSSTDFSYMPPEDEEIIMDDDSSGYHYLRVFDFNPRAVRRIASIGTIPTADPKATCKTRARKGQMLVTESSAFQRYVTSLPYLETTVRLQDLELGGKRNQIEGVMMNAESIMIMMSHSFGAQQGVDILTV
ncbi:hypothetical protein M408DRAFT_329282 [Serendipita vermifera MAFF 305830]|uniref:Uncharacterized protein n=1 Tax=Serendipita vermifera MAFF 305830 TaxID=933852 RepID=A0A0C3AWF0_SERVB|nr:hypothetical protein M408DRAFT_329282 [Serendipita vermifera MAFF 305830]